MENLVFIIGVIGNIISVLVFLSPVGTFRGICLIRKGPMAKIAVASSREAIHLDCIQALIVEFIVTFLFVIAGVGSAMAANKLNGDPLVSLFFVAMAHALVVAVTISAGFRISGGHLNPAITLGLCMGGHITVFRSILYWIDQLIRFCCCLWSYLLFIVNGFGVMFLLFVNSKKRICGVDLRFPSIIYQILS